MKFLRIFLVLLYAVLILLLLIKCENKDAEQVQYENLYFRTVDASSGTVLPDCELVVIVNDSTRLSPSNSMAGEFTVDRLIASDVLTIIASKSGYETNNITVNQDLVEELLERGSPIDIPLYEEMPPCNTGGDSRSGLNMGTEYMASYFLGKRGPGTFKLSFDTGTNVPDRIIVYNCHSSEIGNATPVFDEDIVTNGNTEIRYIEFVDPVITVKIIASGNGSYWNYFVECPE